jgi:hypothetical protein
MMEAAEMSVLGKVVRKVRIDHVRRQEIRLQRGILEIREIYGLNETTLCHEWHLIGLYEQQETVS